MENAERVRAIIAAADRRRRGRAASARAWRAAPMASAAGLCVAAIGRWFGSSAALPLGILATGLVAFTLYLLVGRRVRPISDAVAAALDADAGLGGELRSANWFARRDTRDDWASLHVDRAADRLDVVDWVQLYPPVRERRARAATSLMVAATLALAFAFPHRAINSASARDGELRLKPDSTSAANALPPELLKQLEDLLASAETGTLSVDGKPVNAADLRELLERLKQMRDRAELQELARAMDLDETRSTAEQMQALAERLRHAADMRDLSREFRDTAEELAGNLAEAAKAEKAEEMARAEASSEGQQPGATSQTSEIDDASIQSVKEAQPAAGGAGVVMASSQDAPQAGAPPGFGAGGSGSSTGEARMVEIEQALRQETVEANRDQAGANVEAEVRRQTEQGQATVTFTRGSSVTSDKSRAAAPPPVPEARRTDVQRYFIRKP